MAARTGRLPGELEAEPGSGPLTTLAATWATFVAVFVVFAGGSYAGLSVPWARALTWVGAASVLLGWLVVALRRPELRPTGWLPLAILGATAAFAVSALGSVRPRLSFEPTLIGLATALLFLALLGLLRAPGARRRAGSLVIVLAVAVAVGYLGQVVVEWLNWWLLVGRVTQPPLRPNWAGLTFGSPNLVATVLLLLGPLATVLLAERAGGRLERAGRRLERAGRWSGLAGRRVGRLAAAGLAGACAIAILLTGSRGGYIGVAAALVVGLGLAVIRVAGAEGRRGLGQVAGSGGALGLFGTTPRWAIAVAGAAAVIGAVAAGPALLARFAVGGADDRLGFWKTAILTFLDHPVTGSGPGTWAQLRYAYLGPDDPTYAVPHAHNLYVQVPAELGLVGTAALGVAVVVFLRGWWRRWRVAPATGVGAATTEATGATGPGSTSGRRPTPAIGSNDVPSPLEAAAVLAGLAGLAGQSLVDNLVNLPGISLLVALLVAWVEASPAHVNEGAPAEAPTAPADGRGRPWPALLLDGRFALAGATGIALALLAATPTLVRAELAAARAEAANTAADAGDWATALAGYEAALALDPDHTLYALERGVALAHLGRLAEAREAYAAAAPLDLLPENTIALATLHWQLGETEAAVTTAEDAFRRGARSPLVALNAGRIFEAAGRLDLAADAYAAAIADEPDLGRSSFWHAPERRLELAELAFRARDLVLAREPTDHGRAALVLAYAGLTREALEEADAIEDPQGQAFARLVLAAVGGDTSAVAELRARALADPLDFEAVGWTARLASVAGDPDAARFRTWAAIIRNDAADGIVFERSVVPAPADQRVFGIVANYPFAIYQRPPPRDLLPPEVLVIGARLGD
ncbi:MAG TPA: O-antigen ligase family protein [Candidatus Binatia bacterium]|nr:O-antigen ligase family protein [Candidatus Binatia bacterium]